MAKCDVLDWDKKKVGQVDLNAEVFETPVKKAVLHAVVKWQLACRRSGTHKTKARGEMSGGGKKPFKQKGTGSARQGSSRSPVLVGGGTVFGPKVRDYSYTLPKKVKQEGLRSALSFLNSNGRLFVVDGMDSADGKTKAMASQLQKFGLTKAVLIGSEKNEKFHRATKNLAKIRYYGVEGLNVYDLLKYDTVVLSKDAVKKIEARCGVGN